MSARGVLRVAVVCGALVVAATASASSGASLNPPVIRETFTPLPCPKNPRSTIAIEGCDERTILRTDAAINARVKTIFGLLRLRSARASFVSSERSWLSYRRSSCVAQASFYEGGSAQPIAAASCTIARNRTHLSDLAELLRTLKQR